MLKEIYIREGNNNDSDCEPEVLDDSSCSVPESIPNVIDGFSGIPSPPPQYPTSTDYFSWNFQAELIQEVKKYLIIQQELAGLRIEKTKIELAILKKKISDD